MRIRRREARRSCASPCLLREHLTAFPSQEGARHHETWRRPMIEWSEMHRSIQGAFRKFIEAEVVPHLDDLEHGEMPPYEILRKMVATFGIRDMAQARF